MTAWRPAYVGIGSNLDDPARQVRSAIEALGEVPDCASVLASSLYATEPQGRTDQPDFVNAVAAVLTRLPMARFFSELMRIEQAHGRRRSADDRWGPRTLDLDLLVFGADVSTAADLTVPHPRITERIFVLLPLAELAPTLDIPGKGTVQKLLETTDPGGIARLGH